MFLHRHRVKTLFNRNNDQGWSSWYTSSPRHRTSDIEVQVKEFDEAQLTRICSSKEYGTMYREKTDEHLRDGS